MLANFILDKGGLDKPPFRKLTPIPVRKSIKYLELDDVLKLEKWCKGASDLKLACFIMIGLRTGMRPGEISSLQRTELSLDSADPFIRVLPEKAKARYERVFGISKDLGRFLAARLPKLPQRDPFWIGNLNARFARMVTEAKLTKRATPHWLRHTAITHMITRNVPLNVVQQIVGHQDLTTTSLYANALKRDVYKAVNALDNIPMRRIKPGEEEHEKYKGQLFFEEE